MDTFDKLDRVDLQILRTLQENARLTTKELAARVLSWASEYAVQRPAGEDYERPLYLCFQWCKPPENL